MTTIRPVRRSSFGTNCFQCNSELIAPEWSECRDGRQVHHVWNCWKCDCSFESIVSLSADAEAMDDIMASDDIFPSLLVA